MPTGSRVAARVADASGWPPPGSLPGPRQHDDGRRDRRRARPAARLDVRGHPDHEQRAHAWAHLRRWTRGADGRTPDPGDAKLAFAKDDSDPEIRGCQLGITTSGRATVVRVDGTRRPDQDHRRRRELVRRTDRHDPEPVDRQPTHPDRAHGPDGLPGVERHGRHRPVVGRPVPRVVGQGAVAAARHGRPECCHLQRPRGCGDVHDGADPPGRSGTDPGSGGHHHVPADVPPGRDRDGRPPGAARQPLAVSSRVHRHGDGDLRPVRDPAGVGRGQESPAPGGSGQP